MKNERTISEKDLFYRSLKYGGWNLGYVPNIMSSRQAIYELLVKHGVIESCDRKNIYGNPVYAVRKDFKYTEYRHQRECDLSWHQGDMLVVDAEKHFWL